MAKRREEEGHQYEVQANWKEDTEELEDPRSVGYKDNYVMNALEVIGRNEHTQVRTDRRWGKVRIFCVRNG